MLVRRRRTCLLSKTANVRFWHMAEVTLALTKVCFEGKNGHDVGVTRCLLMTHSGHSQWFLTGNKLGQVATFSAEPNELTRPGEVRDSWLSFVIRLRRL